MCCMDNDGSRLQDGTARLVTGSSATSPTPVTHLTCGKARQLLLLVRHGHTADGHGAVGTDGRSKGEEGNRRRPEKRIIG
jgi:hypothetical protein